MRTLIDKDTNEEFEFNTVFGEDGRNGDYPVGTLKPVSKEFPQGGDMYWHVDGSGVVFEYEWSNSITDVDLKDFGNVWKTEEEAKAHAQRVKSLKDAVEVGVIGGTVSHPRATIHLNVSDEYKEAWKALENKDA